MLREELRRETEAGVGFWGYEEHGELGGVMGIQHVQDITLIRHACTRTDKQNRGTGGRLLAAIGEKTSRPILIDAEKTGST